VSQPAHASSSLPIPRQHVTQPCMYVSMYQSVYVCVFTYMYTRVYEFISSSLLIPYAMYRPTPCTALRHVPQPCMYLFIYHCLCGCVCIYMNIYLSASACSSPTACTTTLYVPFYKSVFVQLCVCVYIYMNIYIYISDYAYI